ncbi:Arc family DNA-binding protein [Rhizobium sp. P007]|uniref:Arc family DNA-binding protein n=1 Tax=Rhizobium sp. P007 TaxID=285908 RepID=UPI00163C0D18|nr:Arc family DNA-binding protein [Rhizobium sp. P007]
MTHQLQDRYIVRMPTGMRETIKKEAAKNHRSMNAEIIHHLSKVFDETKTKKADALA